MDADNESYIQQAISELVKGKTLLVIAHRLNTIRGADQILVVSNGEIAQRGTHQSLMEEAWDLPELRHRAAAEPGVEPQSRCIAENPS